MTKHKLEMGLSVSGVTIKELNVFFSKKVCHVCFKVYVFPSVDTG